LTLWCRGKELPDAELKEALLGQAGLNEEQAEAALVLRYQVDESADLFKAESSVE
jgi:alkylated DNA repair dioxygenase AlkB